MVVISTKGVSTGFEAFPAGLYEASLDKYSEGPSKASGKPSFKTEWTIINPDEYKGRKVFPPLSGSLQEQALFGVKRILLALGFDPDILESEEGFDTVEAFEEVRGNTCMLRATETTYNGRPSNSWDVVLEGETVSADGSGW